MESVSVDSFLECCGSTVFATLMTKGLPYYSLEHVTDKARVVWWNQVSIPGWLEAFAAHPRIGDAKAVEKKWASGEQSAAWNTAANNELQELAEWNHKYEEKFGHVFLICASGKTCLEVLTAIKARFSNHPVDEIREAAKEQQKITELRLAKLNAWPSNSESKSVSTNTKSAALQQTRSVASEEQVSKGIISKDLRMTQIAAHVVGPVKPQSGGSALSPPITTHVLDVSLGRPAVGIDVMLELCKPASSLADQNFFTGDGPWSTIGSSVTNSDGRSGPLMEKSNFVQAGRYRLTFKTGEYFLKTQGPSNTKEGSFGFYPHVSLVFDVKPNQVLEHFHVPLLISPYSYTTYRGS